MKWDRWKPNSGEIFKGAKPEVIAPSINADKVLDIMLGQLEVLRMMTCPAIYIPTDASPEREERKP